MIRGELIDVVDSLYTQTIMALNRGGRGWVDKDLDSRSLSWYGGMYVAESRDL